MTNEDGELFETSDCLTDVLAQGAEARLYQSTYLGRSVVVKERFVKAYRHKDLDSRLTKERLRAEVRGLQRCRSLDIVVPPIYLVDAARSRIVLGMMVDYVPLRRLLNEETSTAENVALAETFATVLYKMHAGDLIHGDLTTSNVLVKQGDVAMIDFGLSFVSGSVEDKAVDLFVLEKTFNSSHPKQTSFFEETLRHYVEKYADKGEQVRKKLEEVRMRGRKRTMVG